MKSVIVAAKRQKDEVSRLVDYIKQLDGTEVVIIPADESVKEYPKRNNYALRQAADMFSDEAFFWLEPDSIPIKSGWLKTIESAYVASGKEFMLSHNANPPHDLIGGIGVYGPKTNEIIPKDLVGEFHGKGWDMWMLLQIPHRTHFSNLIQHSYGIYNHTGHAEPHRFPRDNDMLCSDAVIFHRDKYQDLITNKP
jgi:hypothetical protein